MDRSCLGHLRFGRASPPHGHDHGIEPTASGQSCHLAADRGLAGAFAGPDDGECGDRRRRRLRRRVESEIGPGVGHAHRQGHRRQRHALAVAEHRFVGQVEHELGVPGVDRIAEPGRTVVAGRERRDAELGQRPRLDLLDAADEHGADDVVSALDRGRDGPAGDRRIVLAVDEHHGSHRRRLLSSGAARERGLRFGYSPTGTVRCWIGASCSRCSCAPASEKCVMTWLSPNGNRRWILTSDPSNSSTL